VRELKVYRITLTCDWNVHGIWAAVRWGRVLVLIVVGTSSAIIGKFNVVTFVRSDQCICDGKQCLEALEGVRTAAGGQPRRFIGLYISCSDRARNRAWAC